MRRRDVIMLAAGAATLPAVWPLAARAQRAERVRRVGILLSAVENDPLIRTGIAAFREAMAKLGWVEGRNLRLDIRYAGNDTGLMRTYAAELASLDPDVIFTGGATATRTLQQQTQTIPIVFAGAGDVFESGIVKNVARPEGNTTGVTNMFGSMSGKLVELLKEAVPPLQRIGLVYNPQFTIEDGPQFGPIEEAARVYGLEAVRLPFRNAVDLVHGIEAFATQPNGGLDILLPPPTVEYREAIVELATRQRLPTIILSALIVSEGFLMGYGTDAGVELVRRSAFYVDRILRGAKPGDLPVEFPTRFKLTVNLKTAKAIGLTISETFLVRADEVIE
jgi:putative tryptophan/tyrosine transport system substrate-binding protein